MYLISNPDKRQKKLNLDLPGFIDYARKYPEFVKTVFEIDESDIKEYEDEKNK